jgi:hypothetical protein
LWGTALNTGNKSYGTKQKFSWLLPQFPTLIISETEDYEMNWLQHLQNADRINNKKKHWSTNHLSEETGRPRKRWRDQLNLLL